MYVLTVSELNSQIKSLFEEDYTLSNVWIKGEISNYTKATSGHLYFTLKDKASRLRSVMFRSRASRLQFRPESGMAVIARGYVSVYERDGQYQLYVEGMEPDGVGALYVAYEQLKQKLQEEGLFDRARKKEIPILPQCIGVVTSSKGAALHDIVRVARQRWPGVKMVLAPVAVQGEAAPTEISEGIGLLNKTEGVDLIIAGRGGGSIEELWAFNTEIVARSIYDSDIPIISAVGHETDFTIADMVADARAATPSAAAEMAVPDKGEMIRHIENVRRRIRTACDNHIKSYRWRLDKCVQSRVMVDPANSICAPRGQILDGLEQRFRMTVQNIFRVKQDKFSALAGRLHDLSPLATLARGYCICTEHGTPKPNIITSADQVEPGDNIDLFLKKGGLNCLVKQKIE
ncbi:MAG TPA: exodeoxyribonuclease VII large subunit [Clostridia bacterium]|nr:exodeoxyribonuclease VII large subunit [Clostridia bacterium]